MFDKILYWAANILTVFCFFIAAYLVVRNELVFAKIILLTMIALSTFRIAFRGEK